MGAALGAGVAYFAIVFAIGFVLGTVRVLVLLPRLGEVGGVLLELPLLLAASWLACGWLVDRFAVPAAWAHRLVMGGMAFALLMVAELGVSILAFDRSIAGHFQAYRSWSAALGLAGQLAFATFPLLRRRDTRRPAAAA